MMKRFNTFLLLIVGLFVGCQRNSISPDQLPQIELSFNFENEPFPIGQKPGSLSKQNEIIKARVLLLNCEQASYDTAFDVSPYVNHAILRNITRGVNDSRKYLVFNGTSAYATIAHDSELEGAHGFVVSADVKFNSITSVLQTIISKSGLLNGYKLGMRSGNFYFYLTDTGRTIEVKGNTRITPNEWINVKAGYDGAKLFISVNNELDGFLPINTALPRNEFNLLIGASPSAAGKSDFFSGHMDNIALETWTDYIDLDVIRVSVIDVSNFKYPDSLYASEKYEAFISERYLFWERSRQITWTSLTDIFKSFFPIISQQNLMIKDGMAQGFISAIEGLNYISVAAIKNEVVTHYGEGIIFIHRDRIEKIELTMYQTR